MLCYMLCYMAPKASTDLPCDELKWGKGEKKREGVGCVLMRQINRRGEEEVSVPAGRVGDIWMEKEKEREKKQNHYN